MRYRLRTLIAASAVVPPIGALVWRLFATGLLPLDVVAVPILAAIAVITAIVIVWLCELSDYVGGSTDNRP